MLSMERETLLAAALGGTITPADAARLAAELKSDPSFAADSRRVLVLERLLRYRYVAMEDGEFVRRVMERARAGGEEPSQAPDSGLSDEDLQQAAGGVGPNPEDLGPDGGGKTNPTPL